MKVEKQNVRKDCCSCNFCNKGQLNYSQDRLVYPYENVVLFTRESPGLAACICEECLKELAEKANKIFKEA